MSANDDRATGVTTLHYLRHELTRAPDPLAFLQLGRSGIGGVPGAGRGGDRRAEPPGHRGGWLWSSADGDLQLAGLGCAAELRGSGAERFEAARRGLAGIRLQPMAGDGRSRVAGAGHRHDVEMEGDGRSRIERPVWLGGFGFGTSDGRGAWSAFPALRFVLPELLLVVEGQRARLIATAAEPDAHRLRERAANMAQGLESRAFRPTGPTRRARQPAGPPDADLRSRVERALGAIRDGQAEKVVLATARETCLDRAPDPLAVLARLRRAQPDCALFAMAPEAKAVFMGATPERLLHMDGGALQTMALAGSAPRGGSLVTDERQGQRLLASPKDGREHALVVEAIRASLRDLGAIEIEAPDRPRLRRLATIQHLETPISARFDPPIDILTAAAGLHPTPALGGSPRASALALIDELEQGGPGRGWYAGGVGWLDGRGGGEISVAIRSMLLRGRLALCLAGAGLVAESDAEAEAREIEMKLQVALEALR